MSLIFLNGFEDQLHSANLISTQSMSFNTSTFRTGTTSVIASGSSGTVGNQLAQLALPGGGDATIVQGCAMYFQQSGNYCIGQFYSDNGGTLHGCVVFNSGSGVLSVYRGSNSGTLLGQVTLSGIPLLLNTWGYWEVKWILSDTVGRVTVRFNEAVVLDLTNQDTKNAGTKTVIDTIGYPSGISGLSANLDDYYLVTGTGAPSDFLGDCKVATVYPAGNGDFSQLINDAGNSTNNYSHVNNTGAPVTTSYVESSTVGQRDFYTMGAIATSPPVSVLGMQVTAYVNNPDAGSTRQCKVGVRSAGVEALSGLLPMTAATFLAERAVFVTDPNTSAAWTVAGVNAAQAGFEVD